MRDVYCEERVKGIEPSYQAWEACVLPLNYTRMVGRGGFEPPKASPSDLQSDPFGRLGISPFLEPAKGLEPPTR